MKLTKSWKQETIHKIVRKRTEKDEEILKQKYVEFALNYLKNLNKEVQPLLDKIPKEYLNISADISLSYGNTWKERKYINLPKKIPMPFDKNRDNIVNLSGDSKKEFIKITEEERALKKFKNELKEELFKVIMPCTTSGKLLKTFPEIKDYIDIDEPTLYPIVVQTDKLKAMLNICNIGE